MWQHDESYDWNMSYAQKTAAYILQCSVHHSYFGSRFGQKFISFYHVTSHLKVIYNHNAIKSINH